MQSPLKRELLRPRFDRLREALRAGLRRVIPIFLWVTFLLVPSTATIIFVILLVLNLRLPDRLIPCSRLLLAPRCRQKTFLCVPVQYDRTSIRRYLYNDLAIQCDTDEYFATRGTALIMLVIWPVGVPALYALLLWLIRINPIRICGLQVPEKVSLPNAARITNKLGLGATEFDFISKG